MEKLSNSILDQVSLEGASDTNYRDHENGELVYVCISDIARDLLQTRASLSALQEQVRWVPVIEFSPNEGELCEVFVLGWVKRTFGYWYEENEGDHENPQQSYCQWYVMNPDTFEFMPLDEPPFRIRLLTSMLPIPPEEK